MEVIEFIVSIHVPLLTLGKDLNCILLLHFGRLSSLKFEPYLWNLLRTMESNTQ